MSLKRPRQQTKISDFFVKRLKLNSEKETEQTNSKDTTCRSEMEDSCRQIVEVTDDKQVVVREADDESTADSPSDWTVLPKGDKLSDKNKDQIDATDKKVEDYVIASSPTLELTNDLSEDSEEFFKNVPLTDVDPSSPSHHPNVRMMSEVCVMSQSEEPIVMKELSRGIAKDKLKRLHLGDLDISVLSNHIDVLNANKSPDKNDLTMRVTMPMQGPQWSNIKSALSSCGEVRTSKDLRKLICSYSPAFPEKWDFSGFDKYMSALDDQERSTTLQTLTKMARLATEIEHLCPMSIPILRRQKDQAITLSQHLIAVLLANAFFCTFSNRNEYSALPSINFSRLFSSGNVFRFGKMKDRSSSAFNKLKCILHYFHRVTTCMPPGKVTFHRQVLKESEFPKWSESRTLLRELHISAKGSIEDEDGLLQVDFANKCVGGGALGSGCVQEEIRFMITPELIVSRLFTEILDANECLIVTGCETFSMYSGYADTFEWTGDYIDQRPRDEFGRKLTQVLMIDAIHLQKRSEQFKEQLVKRELNKAYCGFFCPTMKEGINLSAVSTGNWGCGAFGGDRHLKSLIQLMAAAEAGRDVCYFTFDDVDLVHFVFEVHSLLKQQSITVGQIYKMIQSYRLYLSKMWKRKQIKSAQQLYDYLWRHLASGSWTSSPEQTDDDDDD